MNHIQEILAQLERKLIRQRNAVEGTEQHIAALHKLSLDPHQVDLEEAIAAVEDEKAASPQKGKGR